MSNISVRQGRFSKFETNLSITSDIAEAITLSFRVASYPALFPNPKLSLDCVVAVPAPIAEKKACPVRTSMRRISTFALAV